MGRQNCGVKCNAFLVHRVIERDKNFWHIKGALVRSRSQGILVNVGPLFREHKFLTADISDTFYQGVTKFGMVIGAWQINTRCPNLVNFGLLLQGALWPTCPYLGYFCQSTTMVRGIDARIPNSNGFR